MEIQDYEGRGLGLKTLIKKTGLPVNEISHCSTNILEIQNDILVIQTGINNKLEDLNISISQSTMSRHPKNLK